MLIAPDSFKGTLSSPQVAQAIGAGLARRGAEVDLCPTADGGEGSLAALKGALGLETETVTVHDPLGRPVPASFGYRPVEGRSASHAVVEVAAASGLALLAESERDAVSAGSRGTGELMVAAAARGAKTIYVCAGGSATTDGGSGALKVIERAGGLDGAELVVLCDTRTPFERAAAVFAPQKGASPAEVRRLSARLHALARRLPRDPRGVPFTGAAGGLAGGLWAALDARLVPGAPFVLDALDFDRRMRAARAVVSGEGRLDAQSLSGKAVSEVSTRARQAGVPCFAVVGESALDPFSMRILDLQAVLEAGTPTELERAGEHLAGLIWPTGS